MKLSGFQDAETACKTNSVVLTCSGDTGSGKTHFGASAISQGPVAFQIVDMRHHGVLPKFDMSQIAVAEYNYHIPPRTWTYETDDPNKPKKTDSDIKHAAAALRTLTNKFVDDFQRALENVRTVVWDTEDGLWEMFRATTFLNRFGRMAKVQGHNYTEVNMEFSALIRMARSADVNLILLKHVKDEYANDKRTGRKIPAGFGGSLKLADVGVRLTMKNKTVTAEVTKPGWNKALMGMTFDDPGFYDVASTCVPDIDWVEEEEPDEELSLEDAL